MATESVRDQRRKRQARAFAGVELHDALLRVVAAAAEALGAALLRRVAHAAARQHLRRVALVPQLLLQRRLRRVDEVHVLLHLVVPLLAGKGGELGDVVVRHEPRLVGHVAHNGERRRHVVVRRRGLQLHGPHEAQEPASQRVALRDEHEMNTRDSSALPWPDSATRRVGPNDRAQSRVVLCTACAQKTGALGPLGARAVLLLVLVLQQPREEVRGQHRKDEPDDDADDDGRKDRLVAVKASLPRRLALRFLGPGEVEQHE